MPLTVHCLIKNEENFVGYALRSVIDFADKILIFDTGSKDRTVEIVKELVKSYPSKIILEEKGECDKATHTKLRQEMIDRTETDWFMILDGDEVWTTRALNEAMRIISSGGVEVIESYFYECVGDVFHAHYKKSYKTVRFLKKGDVKWSGDYSSDNIFSVKTGKPAVSVKKTAVLENKFWHATHLNRSSAGENEYSSGGARSQKKTLTYFLVGRKIPEPIPEVFGDKEKLSAFASFINFFPFALRKLHF